MNSEFLTSSSLSKVLPSPIVHLFCRHNRFADVVLRIADIVVSIDAAEDGVLSPWNNPSFSFLTKSWQLAEGCILGSGLVSTSWDEEEASESTAATVSFRSSAGLLTRSSEGRGLASTSWSLSASCSVCPPNVCRKPAPRFLLHLFPPS